MPVRARAALDMGHIDRLVVPPPPRGGLRNEDYEEHFAFASQKATAPPIAPNMVEIRILTTSRMVFTVHILRPIGQKRNRRAHR